jgi:hypothetical protein
LSSKKVFFALLSRRRSDASCYGEIEILAMILEGGDIIENRKWREAGFFFTEKPAWGIRSYFMVRNLAGGM